jgi:anaerobic magnesium-protoporphyrin IX monomethyl ester cyclase
MSIVLSHGYFLEDDAKEQKIMRPYPPLGILYISAYLTQHGFENEVFDTTFSNKEKFQNYLISNKPSIIGLYANLMTKINVIGILQFVRQNLPGSKIIIGGPDVRYNAEKYLSHGADFTVMGEGEQTMLELVTYVRDRSGSLSEISGIGYLENGALFESAEREKIKDLDSLPLPARDKIDLTLYLNAWKTFHGKNAISVSTMRGCPYTCKWCSRAVYGLSYRRRSAEKVVQEISEIIEMYNPDSLWFVDDVFTISHKWLSQFSEELSKKKLNISYECITRADRLNEAVIKMLKETGCFRVWIGAESGSQNVIDLMDRRVDVSQVREMIQLSKKHGLQAGTFIMLGYPGETEADISETIHHLKQSNPDQFTITIAYPIKGTELYEEVESGISNQNWATSIERELDFKRTYRRKYYDYAVSHVISEVNYFKAGNSIRNLHTAKLKLKSLTAKTGMGIHRILSSIFINSKLN